MSEHPTNSMPEQKTFSSWFKKKRGAQPDAAQNKGNLKLQRNLLLCSTCILLIAAILLGIFWAASKKNGAEELAKATDVSQYSFYSYNMEAMISFHQNPRAASFSAGTNNIEFFLTGFVDRQSNQFRASGGLNLGTVPFSLEYYIDDDQPYYFANNYNTKYIVNDPQDFDRTLSEDTLVLQQIYFSDIIQKSPSVTASDKGDGITRYAIELDHAGAIQLTDILLQLFKQKYVFIDLEGRLDALSDVSSRNFRAATYTLYESNGILIGAELSANLKLSGANLQTADSISMTYLINYFDIEMRKNINMPELTEDNSVYYKELENAVG